MTAWRLGRRHLTIWGVLGELEAVGLVVLADKGYQGAAHAKLPYRERTSPNPRRKPIARTRNSEPPASRRTPSSRAGRSSASSAAALESRKDRQGHPRASDARGITRMKKVPSRHHRHNRRIGMIDMDGTLVNESEAIMGHAKPSVRV